MIVVDGKKYISEEEFDAGVVKTMHDFFNTTKGMKRDAGPSMTALTSMLLVTEFAVLSSMLFDEDKKEEKKDGRD